MDALTIIGILATVAVIWLFVRPSKSAQRERAVSGPSASRSSPAAGAEPVGATFHWPKLGDFDFEVVGESNYQSAIASLAGSHGERSASTECIAHLVLENSNRYDSSAVAVQILGRTVGYLSREDARSFRRRLGQKGLSGQTTTCDACIVGGGTRRSGEKLYYGVKLDLKPFE